MPPVRKIGLIFILVTAGCAGIGHAPPREPAASGAAQEAPVAASPSEATAGQGEGAAEKPPEARVAKDEVVAVKPEVPRAAPPVAESPGPAPKVKSKAPVPEKAPAPPPLDLTSLEKRLRETDAIGIFSKLTLKNQVDDLLDRFRAHYEGSAKSTLPELRQPFDLLILKVLSLLQDRDSSLAGAILASREAIWGILADPVKFQKLVVQNRG